MMTSDERKAVYIAAMKYGFDDFAQICGVDTKKLLRFLKGEYDPIVEMKVRSNWKVVLDALYGGARKQ
jgi:hypothetical protein